MSDTKVIINGNKVLNLHPRVVEMAIAMQENARLNFKG